MGSHSESKRGKSIFILMLLLSASAGWALNNAVEGAALPAAPGADVPADWWSTVQKDIAGSEYNVTWQEQTSLPGLGAAWQAPNRAHDLRTYFTNEGPRVIRRTAGPGGWVWGLELTGFCGAEAPVVRDVRAEGNRITFERDGLAEWYVNTEAGLEQGFTVYQAPASGDAMVVRMAVRGDLSANMTPGGGTVEFLSAGGVGVIHYAKLLVVDASGKTLPSEMTLGDGGAVVELRVDAADAAYPVTIDPLATGAAWTAEINQADARFGSSVSTAGDVNGDGYSDVIVGAPLYDNGEADEGRVFLYHGSASGLSAAANWSAESNQANANFGYSVSTAGDVNGDGYSDVIVGAPYHDNGESNEGRAFVYHGSASGLSATANRTAESDQAGANFGYSVSTAGDVNGDGYSDVIVGAPYYDNGESNEGRAFVYHGSVSGLPATANRTAESDQAGANFGYSVSTAGDVNGDGYADVIVGAPRHDNGETDEGRAFVYHGSSTGLSAAANWTAESNQADAQFGTSVATAGDVNGDGYSDVIVGAPYYDNGQEDEGRAHVHHGSAAGLAATANWTAESNQVYAFFGLSVSTAGDVNGDGYADVIIGAYGYDNGQTDEGRAHVHHGSATGLSATANWMVESNQAGAQIGYSASTAGDVNGDGYADVIVGAPYYDNGQNNEGRAFVYYGAPSSLSAVAGWTAESNQASAFFGQSVSTAGDVNGDGYADVIVGAHYYDNGQTNEGRAFVYHGSATGLSTAVNWMAESNLAGAYFGYSVSTAGDVNGDGYADVIVGAYYYGNDQVYEGGAYVYHGSASGLSATANWTAESDQSWSSFGWSVSTAGDVNGDGYADVIVGAPNYDNGQDNEGRAYVYHGSATGLSATANWTAESDQGEADFGCSVSTAGDVNGDGYSDIIVGAHFYDNGQTDEGRAFVYHGSPSGLSATANWTVEGNQVNAYFGGSVSTAGDVNGDGYADVIVGAHYYDNGQANEGRAYAYHGSATGLSATASWTAESDQADARFGRSVSTAGDVNGDGYADVIVGATGYDNGEDGEGRAFIYHGSAAGLAATAIWTAEGNQSKANFGGSVSTAGDVNGDGYADVIVGADGYDNGQTDEGRAFVCYGNGESGRGRAVLPRQRLGDDTGVLSPMGLTTRGDVRLVALGRTPFGRSKVKLECEVKPLGTPFNGAGTVKTASWTNTGVAGATLNQLVPGITAGVHHWRVRLLYLPAATPFQQKSRWFTMPWNGWQEGDFRVFMPSPAAPSNPGATSISAGSITWTWTDNSDNETGFKVWADPGTAAPTTLRTTTAAGAMSYAQGGLSPNKQYSFQVAATNLGSDSAKTARYSAWTLAAVPEAPTLGGIGANWVELYVSGGGNNPATTELAVKCTTLNKWAQSSSGALGDAPVYRTAAAWGKITVLSLNGATPHTFAAVARNGAGTVTAESPGTTVTTHTTVPNVAGLTQAAAGIALAGAQLGTGAVTQQCSDMLGAGLVISQSPVPGTTVPVGGTVALWVSTGMCPVAVPNVAGLTQAAAGAALTGANLTTGAVTQQCSDTVPAGLVISQSPASGGTAPYGSAVALVVSTGLCSVTVPNVAGQAQAAAGATLTGANLVVGAVTQQHHATVPAGQVISQNPAAGQVVPPGTAVALVVSKGADTTAPTGTILINNNLSVCNSHNVTLKLTWDDGDGTGVVRMKFSNDGTTWTAWEPLAATKAWTLPAGEGYRTVRVMYRDAAGNNSAVFNDFIRVDTILPTGTIIINNGAVSTTNRNVSLGLTWNDGDGSGVVRMRLSIDGKTWTAWETLKAKKGYTLPAATGKHYTVRVTYRDAGGNISAAYNDYIRLDPLPGKTVTEDLESN